MPGFPGDSGFPGQPGMLGQPGMFGQPGFGGQRGMLGFVASSSRRRGQMTGPGLVAAIIGLVIFVIIAITIFSHMSSDFGTPSPSGPCVGGPMMGETGQSIGNGNFRFQCADGGSTVVHLGNN
jgi:hypothetical protein